VRANHPAAGIKPPKQGSLVKASASEADETVLIH
jgi:hypothetical protein